MYCVIYEFSVLSGEEALFESAWEELTKLIYAYEGSLGSRLHKSDSGKYIAYAQWPDQPTHEFAGEHLPPEAEAPRSIMYRGCSEVKTLHTMHMVTDLLKYPEG